MGLLQKDLQDRNDVYDQLIAHFKDKIASNNKNSNKNEWIIESYDNELKKADSGEAYKVDNVLAHGFGGLSIGLCMGGVALQEPIALLGALATAGISTYAYIKFKNLTLGRALGTRMFYAETLQKIVEEDGLKYPFDSGNLEDYEHIEAYIKVLQQADRLSEL